MSDSIEARGLARVATQPTGTVVLLILEDLANKITGHAINPEGLNALLTPLLRLAARWADQADLEVEKLAGPHHALPAQRMTLMPGRSAQECAVRIFVGKIELTFLIPLDETMAGVNNLKKLVSVLNDETDSGFSN